MTRFRITYYTVTPTDEPDDGGYTEENGFVEPRYGMRVPIEEINPTDWPDSALDWTLEAAEMHLGRGGMEDSGNWWTTIDGIDDYVTGASTRESLHPPRNITGASYARVGRIFVWRRA